MNAEKDIHKISESLCCLTGTLSESLKNIKEVLTKIDSNTDELEFNIENLTLEAEQINLNTDEVEQLLNDLKVILTPLPLENKTYQITLGQTIIFGTDSVFAWAAGVYNGGARYDEGAGMIGPYNVGDSFGNGDSTNRIKNLNPISITTDPTGDVRISVLQVPGYVPTII